MKSKILKFVLIFLMVLGGVNTYASSSPIELLKTRDKAIKEFLKKAGKKLSSDEKSKLKSLINDIIDFRKLGTLALRNHWEKIEAAKREEFLKLFTEIIEENSIKKVDIYQTEKIEYVEQNIEANEASVTTQIETEDDEFEIIYLMNIHGCEWKIYDMVIDDVSTADNYRSEFNREINERGFDSLLEKLRKKRKELEKEETK